MFNRIIVPTDGSDYSWRAVAVGEALARQCDAPLELLEVVTYAADVKRAEQLIRERLADTPLSIPASACARVMQRSVGFTIADHVANVNGGMLVMSTFGRGRTETILGSVAVDVLREMFGPLVLVGPRASTDRVDLRGELIVPVDGSDRSRDHIGTGCRLGDRLRGPSLGRRGPRTRLRYRCPTRPRARMQLDSPATSAVAPTTMPSTKFSTASIPARRSLTSPRASERR